MTYGVLRKIDGEYVTDNNGYYKKFCENCKEEIHEHYQGLINMGDMNHKCYRIDRCKHCGKDL